MKKYILLLITALSFAQASNQMVSFTQAQSLGFSLNSGQSHTTSNQCMSKNDALVKYNLSANSMSSYTSNQLVPKSAWVNGVVNYLFYYAGSFGDRTSACSYASDYLGFYSNTSILSEGSIVYTNSGLTNVFVGNGSFYLLSDINSTATINSSGVVSSVLSCQPAVTSYGYDYGSIGYTNTSAACSGAAFGNYLYSADPYIDLGTVLYMDANLTTPFNGITRYWSQGDSLETHKISSAGVVTAKYTCF